MQITDATLYLPISQRMVREVLDDSEALENVVSGLAVPQLAALVTLQYLPKLNQERSPLPERFLAQVIEAARDDGIVFERTLGKLQLGPERVEVEHP